MRRAGRSNTPAGAASPAILLGPTTDSASVRARHPPPAPPASLLRSRLVTPARLGPVRMGSVRRLGPIRRLGPVRWLGPVRRLGPVRWLGPVRRLGSVRRLGHVRRLGPVPSLASQNVCRGRGLDGALNGAPA